MVPRERHDLHVEPLLIDTRDGEADAVHGNGPLAYDLGGQRRRILDGDPPAVAVLTNLLDGAGGIDVPLHEMSVDARIGAHRPLEIDASTALQAPQSRHANRLWRNVHVHAGSVRRHD